MESSSAAVVQLSTPGTFVYACLVSISVPGDDPVTAQSISTVTVPSERGANEHACVALCIALSLSEKMQSTAPAVVNMHRMLCIFLQFGLVVGVSKSLASLSFQKCYEYRHCHIHDIAVVIVVLITSLSFPSMCIGRACSNTGRMPGR